MLNEKIVLSQKLMICTALSVFCGFFLGIALILFLFNFLSPNVYSLWPIPFFILSGIGAYTANKVYKQLREYILSPYVKMENEDDQQNTQSDAVLDSPAD